MEGDSSSAVALAVVCRGACEFCVAGIQCLAAFDELVELNQAQIQEELEDTKAEIKKDLEKDIHDVFKKAFKGSKIINLK